MIRSPQKLTHYLEYRGRKLTSHHPMHHEYTPIEWTRILCTYPPLGELLAIVIFCFEKRRQCCLLKVEVQHTAWLSSPLNRLVVADGDKAGPVVGVITCRITHHLQLCIP